MNKYILKLVLLVLVCMTTTAYADNLQEGCEIKVAKIQKEIEYAKIHNNTHRLSGLETALANVQQNCTNKGLLADLNKKLTEKQQKVAEREVDLKEAQANGNIKKIAKYQKKLAEAKQELLEVQQKLAAYSK